MNISQHQFDHSNPFLLISYFFPPVGGAGSDRITKMCKFLPRYGWLPYILTVKNPYYTITNNTLDEKILSEVTVHRSKALLPKRFAAKLKNYIIHHKTKGQSNEIVPTNPSPSRNMFLRKYIYPWLFFPDEYMGWIPWGFSMGCSLVQKHGLRFVYTSSPPNSVHCIGSLIKRRCKIPWIAEFRDTWDVWGEWYNPHQWKFRNRLEIKLERSLVESADHIVAVTDGIKEDLYNRILGLENEKCSVIPNGWDPDDFRDIIPHNFGDRFTLVHAGSFYWWRKPDKFLEGLKRWLESGTTEIRKRCYIEFLGRVEPENVMSIQRLGLSNIIRCPGMLSYQETLARIAGANVLILIVGDLLKPQLMRTRKLYDYIITGKPILIVGSGSEAESLIKNLGVSFTVVDPDNPEEIASALDEFARNTAPSMKLHLDETDPQWQFSWQSIAQQSNLLFQKLYKQTI